MITWNTSNFKLFPRNYEELDRDCFIHEAICLECGEHRSVSCCVFAPHADDPKGWPSKANGLCAWCLEAHYAMHELAGDKARAQRTEREKAWAQAHKAMWTETGKRISSVLDCDYDTETGTMHIITT